MRALARPGRHRFDREIAALAVPALGTLAADPLVSLVDTAFVGRIGATELAALGLASAVFAVAFFLFNFLAYATTPLVAAAVGAGRRTEAGRIALTALALAAGFGVVVAGALAGLADPLLRAMGADAGTLDPATSYLRIRALAAPAFLVVLAGHGAFRGYQDTRTPLAASLVVNAVNVVLDPLFIFGFGWGIAGAAWATVAAQWLGVAIFLGLLLHWRRERLGIELVRPAWDLVRSFLGTGRDLVARTLLLLAAFTLATAVAARVGTVAVAAHQVAIQVWLFLALAIDALAVAAQAMVGRYRGIGDEEAARAAGNRILTWSVTSGVALAALLAVLRPVLPDLFSDDAVVVAAVGTVYPFVVLTQPLNAAVFAWDGIVMGAGDFAYLRTAMAIAAVAAGAVLLAVRPMGWGLEGVWWGLTVLMVVRAATLAWWQWGRRHPSAPQTAS